jgi:hypothetical protein
MPNQNIRGNFNPQGYRDADLVWPSLYPLPYVKLKTLPPGMFQFFPRLENHWLYE